MPMTAFIGVRISWLIVARKELFASLAASACGARLLRLGEEARVAQRDAHAGGDRDSRRWSAFVEDTFALRALHADHAFGCGLPR